MADLPDLVQNENNQNRVNFAGNRRPMMMMYNVHDDAKANCSSSGAATENCSATATAGGKTAEKYNCACVIRLHLARTFGSGSLNRFSRSHYTLLTDVVESI